ncbi:hypothetical protein PF003_g11788 [Phytophthora fragariae]|nr:hypothetical protein PF003_g11788 [Phytophthora fragariae]
MVDGSTGSEAGDVLRGGAESSARPASDAVELGVSLSPGRGTTEHAATSTLRKDGMESMMY